MAAMRWMLMVALLTGALGAAQSSSQVREEWMVGFVKLEEGGKAEEAGRLAAALGFYREALAVFREVQRKYPAWNPSLLTYRISFCEERIAGIQARLGEETSAMPKTDLEGAVRDQIRKIDELTDTNQRLATELTAAREALDRARQEAARSVGRDSDIRELVKERKQLQDRLALQAAEVERLTGELRALEERGGLKAQADRLQRELEQAQASRAEFERGYEVYKRAWENVRKRLQEVNDAREKDSQYVATLRERTQALEAEGRRQATLLAEAQRDRLAAQGALEQAETEARTRTAEARDALARLDAMRRENEDLRAFRDGAVAQGEEVAGLRRQVRELAAAKAAAEARTEGLRADVEKSVAAAAQLEQEMARLRETAAAQTVADRETIAGLRAQLAARPARPDQDAPDAQAVLPPGMAERLAEAEEQLAATAAAREQIEARLAAAAKNLADSEAARELLEARLAAAERARKAAEDVAENQKRLLAAGEERAQEVAALGRQLQERETRIEAAQREIEDLRARLDRAERVAAKEREEARTGNLEAARLRTRLEQAEQRAAELDEQLARQQRSRPSLETQATAERLREATTLVETMERESERLQARTAEQLALLRSQEQAIARLEQERAGLQGELAARDERLEALRQEQQRMLAKNEVTDGLAASIDDLDRELATAKAAAQRALAERDQAKAAEREVRSRLEITRADLARTRDALERQANPASAGELFRDQIRRLTIQLEAESQRRRTLEELLSRGEREAAPPPEPEIAAAPRPLPSMPDRQVAPAVPTVSEAAERERRERERQMLVRGYLRQGVAAEQAGNVEAARWNYGRALENEPDNRLATQRLGLIAVELGDDREAIAFLKRAFRLDPDNLDILLPLGFALVRQGEPDLAVSMLSRAVALEPDNPHAHRCLGIASTSLGWFDVAETQFRRAHHLNPEDAETAFNLAVLLATRQNPRMDDAKTWYLRARELGAAPDPGLDQVFGLDPGQP